MTCGSSSCDVLQVMSRGVKMETLEDQAGILRDDVSCKTSPSESHDPKEFCSDSSVIELLI